MIPTRIQLSKGKRYNVKVEPHNLEMYKKHGIYFVSWGTSLRGFWTYEEARQHASTILIQKGI